MPKIIKSIRWQTIRDNAPKYFLQAKTAFISDWTYIALADDGFIYEIGGETGYEGGWNAKKFKSNPNAKDKTNFYEMLIDSKYTEQESQWLKTKKELIEALEAGTLKLKKDKAAEKYRKYKNKKTSEVQQI